MSHNFNDELISAYLDGELTADEQALVEQKLSESPEHQQMLGELSALRDSFQSLPSFSLGEKFGGRVLRAAERSMLADRPENMESRSEPARDGQAATPAHTAIDHATGDRRGWQLALGSIAAIAALLLLTLFLADIKNEPELSPTPAVSDNSARGRRAETGTQEGFTERGSDQLDSAKSLTDDRNAEESAQISNFGNSTVAPHAQREKRLANLPAGTADNGSETESQRPLGVELQRDEIAAGRAVGEANKHAAGFKGADGIGGGAGQPADAAMAGGSAGDPAYAEDVDGLEPIHYTVVVEVPRDQFARQPVELALTKSNVHEVGEPAQAEAFRQPAPASRASSLDYGTAKPNAAAPLDRTNKEDARSRADDAQLANELLVVATGAEIKTVCESLSRQGFRTFVGSQEVSDHAEVSPRTSPMRIQQSDIAANESMDSASEKAAADKPKSVGRVLPGVDAVKKAESAELRSGNFSNPRATEIPRKSPTDTARNAKPRAPAGPIAAEAGAARDEEADDPSLPADAPLAGPAISGKDAGKTQEFAQGELEKQKSAAMQSYFLRVAGGEHDAGDAPAKEQGQVAEQRTSSYESKKQALASSRGSDPAPLAALSASDEHEHLAVERQTPTKLRVRFIIRPVAAASSATASEPPAAEP